jgi:hypothetical protein
MPIAGVHRHMPPGGATTIVERVRHMLCLLIEIDDM